MKRIFFIGEHANLAREVIAGLEQINCLLKNEHFVLLNTATTPWLGGYRLPVSEETCAELDAADERNIEHIVNAKPDIIFNASGRVNSYFCRGHELDSFRSNTQTCFVLSTVMEKLPNVRLIHLSTTASYTSPKIITEETTPQFFQTAYSFTKLLGEQHLLNTVDPARLLNIRVVFVYGGLHDTSSVILKLIRRHVFDSHPEVSINMDLTRNKCLLHVSDFVRAVLQLIETEASGTVLIGNPDEAMTYSSVLSVLKMKGIDVKNVTWNREEESLGDHVPRVDRLYELARLSRKEWPKVKLTEGIDLELSRYVR
jgi:nucleoside-diphosphate-sugar epimerase